MRTLFTSGAVACLIFAPGPALAQQTGAAAAADPELSVAEQCASVPEHGELAAALREVVEQNNGGLGNHVWGAIVNRAGSICAVAHSGGQLGDQWIGSRGIAAQKAFTANAFSLDGFALSTANLFWPTQPDNSLYGLVASHPVDPALLLSGPVSNWGTESDPLIGHRLGGVVVFGGGVALYTPEGDLVGALGVSGDESCTDHIVAWRIRHRLNLDNVPKGVSREGTDNILHDLAANPKTGQRESSSGYGHPECGPEARQMAQALHETNPTGAEP